jgi:phage shock protein C
MELFIVIIPWLIILAVLVGIPITIIMLIKRMHGDDKLMNTSTPTPIISADVAENQQKILEMLQQGKVSIEESRKLLETINQKAVLEGSAPKSVRRLRRSQNNRILGGICGAIADYFDLDPLLVRLGYVLMTLLTCGVGIIFYIIAALAIPYDKGVNKIPLQPDNCNKPTNLNDSSRRRYSPLGIFSVTILGLLVLFLSYHYKYVSPNVKLITFSELQEEARTGKIKNILLKNNRVEGEYKIPGEYRYFKTTSLLTSDWTVKTIDELRNIVGPENFDTRENNPWMQQLLCILIPVLLILLVPGLIGYFLFRIFRPKCN